MKSLSFLCATLLFVAQASAQSVNYCGKNFKCSLSKYDPAHFNPFYNGHLCENFNPKQADFSRQYDSLMRRRFSKIPNRLDEFEKFNSRKLWLTGNRDQNGVLGSDYTRIRLHIGKVENSPDGPLRYTVFGKSNVMGNVCDFKGEINLVAAYYTFDEALGDSSWSLFYEYLFFEDSTQHHVGIFQGKGNAYVLANKNGRAWLDTTNEMADGSHNRNFVGTWTQYGSEKIKKCIWGDYRLPFTFDFDCGDGEMIVCEKYAKNGWQSFNEHKEFEQIGDTRVLKHKWWQ